MSPQATRGSGAEMRAEPDPGFPAGFGSPLGGAAARRPGAYFNLALKVLRNFSIFGAMTAAQ